MSRLALKRWMGHLAGALPNATSRKVILLYHSLGMRAPAVMPERFRQQLSWLAANAELMSLATLLGNQSQARLQVALTFDDGYASLHDAVAPLLEQQGTGATVYLNTGRIGDSIRNQSDPSLGHYPGEYFLTWPEVQSLANAGWLIGSHGVEHTDLTAVPSQLSDMELHNSKSEIERRLKTDCEHFAYTWGRFTGQLQQQVKVAGYHSAASGLHGPLLETSDRFALPRIDVRADYELPDFIAAVSGRWDFLGFKQRLARKLA